MKDLITIDDYVKMQMPIEELRKEYFGQLINTTEGLIDWKDIKTVNLNNKNIGISRTPYKETDDKLREIFKNDE